VSLDELRECGLSRDAVAVRVRNGGLHPVHRGVYAVGHANLPREGRFLAAVKACGPSAVLSHFSAAALWGFLDWTERYLEVTVAAGYARRHPQLRVHRTSTLCPMDVSASEGIPVTSPPRTLVDLAGSLDEQPLRRVVRRAQSVRRVSVRQLAEAIARLGPRRGSRKLARIVARGPAPTGSELEDVVLDLILAGGFAHPDVNKPMVVEGRRVVPDFRWPDERLVVEADGRAWHDNEIAREDDAERQALLEAHGESVVRVTWNQAIANASQTLARLRSAGAPPAAGNDQDSPTSTER
jgi:hypothetical protein